jgi:hypothetical protein
MKLICFTLACLGTYYTTAQSLPDNLYPPDTLSISYHSDWTKAHYPEKIKEFKKNPLAMNDIVFLGNAPTPLIRPVKGNYF